MNQIHNQSQEMRATMRFMELSMYPQLQAEAIARHYLSHLEIAKQLAHCLRHAQYDRSTWAMEVIQYELALIKTNHLCDLGIPLEWPKPKDDYKYMVCSEPKK